MLAMLLRNSVEFMVLYIVFATVYYSPLASR
ncbi:unnamed protein product [Mycetohabitans rhizoxinica HKI 454]|uniref:Uncharacterized protein n=1 Tax=Mycetohabitans rhizoxinica (strain DSM 19002 / CIP 109453 / HKI 454) TaxID=882378 RepID=E5ANJ4_MYCRK|nr:unnamed protein product [Mycetohabitans rhizoxinica HKI 454]